MDVLLIHQNFPGQFKFLAPGIARRIASSGGQVVCLGVERKEVSFIDASTSSLSNIKYIQYKYLRSSNVNIHPWLQDIESKTIRAESCASACMSLKSAGFSPDIIIQHSGWGEGLYLDIIFPGTPILSYQEFFYQNLNSDYDFDPEFQGNHHWHDHARLQTKKASQLIALNQASWNLTPTSFQKRTFPKAYQPFFSVIHDGIDCTTIDAIPEDANLAIGNEGYLLSEDNKLVTCVMRSVEPYRGCHTLIRAIPYIQKLNKPNTHLVIIGNTETVSYGAVCPTGSWKDHFLKEIEGHYDVSKVHFVGSVTYPSLIKLLKRSDAHIYLTYPFVLSWSLLEAMACKCAIVGSDTAPVREVISDNVTGLLTDFFKPEQLAIQVARTLDDTELATSLGSNARSFIDQQYRLDKCLSQQISLVELVAGRVLRKE